MSHLYIGVRFLPAGPDDNRPEYQYSWMRIREFATEETAINHANKHYPGQVFMTSQSSSYGKISSAANMRLIDEAIRDKDIYRVHLWADGILNWTPYCGTAVQNWLYYSRKVLPFAREGDTAGWRLTRFTHADGSVSYWREGEPMTGNDAMRYVEVKSDGLYVGQRYIDPDTEIVLESGE